MRLKYMSICFKFKDYYNQTTIIAKENKNLGRKNIGNFFSPYLTRNLATVQKKAIVHVLDLIGIKGTFVLYYVL